ncbi:uncharacterized protein LOC143212129 [Lasioglossum baleicum]|uniref:uncharacterized protein LOC143212129 n=1 Tax=Lasioglossum baleicum TaxID=434251 RepID=UPI003FCC6604
MVNTAKKECLWPPFKLMAKFNRALQGGILPDDNWTLYDIRRVFYETDDLSKAREKCRQAESESEIATEWEGEQGESRRKRKIKKVYDSDEYDNGEHCINFPDAQVFDGRSAIDAVTPNVGLLNASPILQMSHRTGKLSYPC